MRMRHADLSGRRFGLLVVIRRGELRRIGLRARLHWVCRCDCGEVVQVRSDHLVGWRTRSCGCLMSSGLRKRGVDDWRVHDFPEYVVWASMIDRCHVKTGKDFRNYGGRGVKVCGRWRKDFLQFLSDMGPRPDGRYSIERLDVEGDYEPGNCCWVTGTVQARNRRDTVFVEWEGERVKLADLCERLGCKRGVVYARLRIGWDIARAVGRA